MKVTEILNKKNNMKFYSNYYFASILYSAEAYSWELLGIEPFAEIAENHISNKSKHKLKKDYRKTKSRILLTGQISWKSDVKYL